MFGKRDNFLYYFSDLLKIVPLKLITLSRVEISQVLKGLLPKNFWASANILVQGVRFPWRQPWFCTQPHFVNDLWNALQHCMQ
jgi:hypothetical protein